MEVSVVESLENVYCFEIGFRQAGFLAGDYAVRYLFSEESSTQLSTIGSIVDSEKNFLGERACDHYDFKGWASVYPSNFVTTAMTSSSWYEYTTRPYVAVSTTYKYRTKSVYTSTHTGPVFYNRKQNVILQPPDDLTGYPNQGKFRNYLITVAWSSADTVVATLTGEIQSAPYLRPWMYQYYRNEFKLDFVTHRYKILPDGGWKPMGKLIASTPTVPSSPYRLPRLSTHSEYARFFSRLDRKYRPTEDEYVYGDLVRRCANDARTIPVNSLELVKEIATIAPTLRSMLSLLGGQVNLKLLSSAYLSYKYGIRLTIMDIKTVAEGLTKRIERIDRYNSRSRARETSTSVCISGLYPDRKLEYNYKIIYKTVSTGLLGVLRTWFDSGLALSGTNIWDLIPFSFVVDWFLRVESYLNAVDANTYWSTYDILGTVYSRKIIYPGINQLFDQPGWTFVGDIEGLHYSRNLGRRVHKPLFFDPTPRNFKNYAELASLIIVNKR